MNVATRPINGHQRFTSTNPCPICKGSEDDARGQGSRCHGFLGEDGSYAHCSREEFGAGCHYSSNSQTFAHKLKGACNCGQQHGPADPKIGHAKKSRGIIDNIYAYQNRDGTTRFEVVRYRDPKGFAQRQHDPIKNGAFIWSLKGIEPCLFRLPMLAANPEKGVLVLEGEKDVLAVGELGLLATCNPMGAGKWRESYTKDLTGRVVAILPDNDKPGRDHAHAVAVSVFPVAKSVKIVELEGLSEGGDVSDWIANGGTAQQLKAIIAATPNWQPVKVHDPDRPASGGTAVEGSAPPETFNLTDLGNAERLVNQHGQDLKYCHPWNKWLIWDGRRWALDDTGEAPRRARQTARGILFEAGACPNQDLREALAKHSIATEKRDRLTAMLALAEAERGIPVLPDQLLGDPWLFNCLNGTLDLRTGTLRPHVRGDFNTKLCKITFDANAKCPLWEDTIHIFLQGIPELIDYFRRICGYSMTGVIRDHILPVAYGKGANGKSTILGTLLDVFGADYAMKCPPDMLMAKKTDSHPTDRADLFGKRLVIAIETEGQRRLNETMVKELTGGDKIRARRMREDFWEFDPTHTLLMATNHKPGIRGTDTGIWRRLKLIPFSVTKSGKSADKEMPEKLRSEFPGILAWCVRGCLEWQRLGLEEPKVVEEATADYRKEQDVIGAFLDECVVLDPKLEIKSTELYARYCQWGQSGNEYVMSHTMFGRAMEERGVEKKVSNGVKYKGLTLRNSDSPTVQGGIE